MLYCGISRLMSNRKACAIRGIPDSLDKPGYVYSTLQDRGAECLCVNGLERKRRAKAFAYAKALACK